MSTISTRFNPDLLIGESLGKTAKQGTFIRGNEYFANKKTDTEDTDGKDALEEGGIDNS